jgi:hypothetical protein
VREEGDFHRTEEQQVEYLRGRERERERGASGGQDVRLGGICLMFLSFGMRENEQNIKIRMKNLEEKEKYLSQDTFTQDTSLGYDIEEIYISSGPHPRML